MCVHLHIVSAGARGSLDISNYQPPVTSMQYPLFLKLITGNRKSLCCSQSVDQSVWVCAKTKSVRFISGGKEYDANFCHVALKTQNTVKLSHTMK